MRHPLALALVGMTVVMAACGGAYDASSGGTPKPTVHSNPPITADRSVDGHTFVSTAIKGHTLAPDTRITLTFGTDGLLGMNADCNGMSARYHIDGDRLVVDGNVVSTMMACVGHNGESQDAWLVRFLQSRPKMALTDTTLQLSDGTVTVTLVDVKVADPTRPLEGTKWVADTLLDGTTVSSAVDGKTTLVVDGSRATGHIGCNGYGAHVDIAADTLTFSDVVTTRIACPFSDAGTRLSALLGGDRPVHYTIDGERLTLTAADGTGLAFRAGP